MSLQRRAAAERSRMNQRHPLSRRQVLAGTASALGAWLAPTAIAHAQKTSLTWLVGQPPGGTTDTLTRLLSRQVESLLGQTVVVENRPGAAGALALQAAARAPRNGQVLVTVPGPVLSAQPVPQIGGELAGVALLARGPMVLVGTMAQPMPPTLEALLSAVRKDPGAYAYATSGNGTSQHLAGELVNQMAHAQLVHVPYKGGGQAVIDVVGGQVPLAILGLTPVLPHIRSNKLRAYGVSASTRSPQLPEVPTLSEAGLKGFSADQWFAVATTAGTAPERIEVLNAAIVKALQSPEVQSALAQAGLSGVGSSAEQATSFVTGDLARWQALATKAQLKLD